jgi:TonB-dependent receptor
LIEESIMMKKRTIISLAVALVVCVSFLSASAATNGTVEGFVKDAQTGDALPGANVLIVKSSLGASTDVNGKYVIRNVPPGSYLLRATYIGYKQKESQITVAEGQTLKFDFKLSALAVEGEEVVITAQAAGQKEAINQQLTSLSIVNVVSRARIQELPDANAAESVSRLPGISLVRTGGEGAQVVIRGLSPQYNQITIDGVELPSNMPSQNNVNSGNEAVLGDRGGDLSMISSSMLGGIEVTKAITPDMDATLIGGVVNFGLRKAVKTQIGTERDESWVPLVEIVSQGGYNQLKKSTDNYRFVGSLEKRFLDQSLGVFVQASSEKRNLSANVLGASYYLSQGREDPNSNFTPDLTSVSLTDVFRKRERLGGTVVVDYVHETGEIDLMNFVSSSDTKEISRSESINASPKNMYFSASDATNTLNVLSNLLSVKQDFSIFHADLKLSHSYSESRNPDDLFFNFYQQDAGLANKGDLTKLDPKSLASLVVPSAATSSLDQIQTSASLLRERTMTASLDLQTEFTLTSDLTGKFKFGGMFQHRSRAYDYNLANGSQMYSGGGGVVTAIQTAYPGLIMNGSRISLLNFSKDSYEYGTFLNGDYTLPYPINVNLMWDMLPIAKRTSTLEGYRVNELSSIINDYSGTEDKSAVYAMFTLNIGDNIAVIPGARYQNLATSYQALRGEMVPGGLQGKDTTVDHSHGFFLPMVHIRYKPLDWLQLHFAYTNTLNYPDYSTITPRYLISTGSIQYNNHALRPATSENLDFVVSVLSNELGLISVNGFRKLIRDLVFPSNTYLTNLSAYPDLPQGRTQLYAFSSYVNNPIDIDLYGIETEWQTHFWYLPEPFSGLVLNINYTHIFSEAKYPRATLTNEYLDDGSLKQTIVDTSYASRMLNQPNDILNLAMGYDYKGFSLRVSLLYQDNIFKRPDFWKAQRTNSAKYTRWDLSLKQEMPWYGLQLFFNLNNLTGEDDVDVNQRTEFPASTQRYGMSADAGLRIRL